jgi:hypothetical protein
MSRSRNGRRRSLNAMEIQRRQIREDATLTAETARNLITRSLGLSRDGLSQEEQDLGMGLIEARRALLATIPTLRGVERVHAVIRLMEQMAKATGALRRSRRGSMPLAPLRRRPVPVGRPYVSGEDDEDDAADAAGGGDGV